MTTPVVELASEFLRNRLAGFEPEVAIVLGSGLGGLADAAAGAERIPYREIPGFPDSTVIGHKGELVAAELEGIPVLLQNGRFHLYEGHAPDVVALPVRVIAELGVGHLFVTNAAGGLNPTFTPPTLMLIADHINFMWRNPLAGPVVAGESRWPDLLDLYDPELQAAARAAALEAGIVLHEGVYAAVLGPSYETPAEIRMLQRLGADAVGMSTVPEVLTARARGVRVLGVSSITNPGAGLSVGRLIHEEVVEAGVRLAHDLETLLRGVLKGFRA